MGMGMGMGWDGMGWDMYAGALVCTVVQNEQKEFIAYKLKIRNSIIYFSCAGSQGPRGFADMEIEEIGNGNPLRSE